MTGQIAGRGALLAATVATVLTFGAGIAPAADAPHFINIGTAGIGGGFYPSGGYLCQFAHKTSREAGKNVRCTVEATAGSVANLRSLATGDLEIAFSQADWQYHAWNGSDVFKEAGPNRELRHLFALHGDVVHVVARKGLGIRSFLDLKGRTVNTGNVGSGTEASIYAAMAAYPLEPASFFGQETKLTSREQAAALCDGKIDAFLYPLGLGGASVTEAAVTCGAEIADWWDDTVKKRVAETPYLNPAPIPAGTYPGQAEEKQSFGWSVTVVTTSRLPDDIGYILAKALFDNFEDFKKQSPLYVGITREGSASFGRTAPFHAGAERYLKETGLLP